MTHTHPENPAHDVGRRNAGLWERQYRQSVSE